MIKGIDVSGYQTDSVFTSYEPDFAMIKATEGVGYVSDGFTRLTTAYEKYAEKTGKPCCKGFYHYARPETGNTAQAEADNFLNQTLKFKGTALYALDWEGAALNYGPKWAVEFLRIVRKRTGSIPFIYMSSSVTRSYDWSTLPFEDCRLWVAQWGGGKPDINYWPTWSMWQYSSGAVDLDYFNAGTDAWFSLAQGNQSVTVPGASDWKITVQSDCKIILEKNA